MNELERTLSVIGVGLVLLAVGAGWYIGSLELNPHDNPPELVLQSLVPWIVVVGVAMVVAAAVTRARRQPRA